MRLASGEYLGGRFYFEAGSSWRGDVLVELAWLCLLVLLWRVELLVKGAEPAGGFGRGNMYGLRIDLLLADLA